MILSTRIKFCCLLFSLSALACDAYKVQPHIVLTIEDPQSLAQSAVTLRIRKKGAKEKIQSLKIDGSILGQTPPFELAIAVLKENQQEIWLEALSANATILARSYNQVNFSRATQVVSALLTRPCSSADLCDDGDACTLDSVCSSGSCVGAPNPACEESQ